MVIDARLVALKRRKAVLKKFFSRKHAWRMHDDSIEESTDCDPPWLFFKHRGHCTKLFFMQVIFPSMNGGSMVQSSRRLKYSSAIAANDIRNAEKILGSLKN